MEENKHFILVLVESVLKKRLKLVDEIANMDIKTKEEVKKQMIETFIKETISGSNSMFENEVREVVSELLGEKRKGSIGEDR